MEVTDFSKSRRLEFVLSYSALSAIGITDEFYISEWRLLPSDWRQTSGGWDGILQVSDANTPNWWQYYQLILSPGSGTTINLGMDRRDTSGTET